MSISNTRKTALLLGGGKGLGFGVAEALVKQDINVILVGRDEKTLMSAKSALSKYPVDVSVLVCDLSEGASVAAMIKAVDDLVDGVDIVLLNGGGPPPLRASDFDANIWRTQFMSLFLAQTKIATHFLGGMRLRGFGRILAVSSTSIREPIPGLAASNALRSALAGWAKTLATEVASDGVTVNLILPGRFATERTERLDQLDAEEQGTDPAEIAARSQREIPIGRYGTPQEFGEVVAFLASDQARYITGVALPVDGGLSRSML
ncbi:SDR family oxidoreductase [Agrobacterium larrymoorei]|uniref:SDR family oxidoreductase n=1 Tax=Agrobacterium larrymoorei TaxID=160699 RepID=UPI0015719028|nr:SDR family oxidoreductase [Agrobacterium larrymoorei]NTJ44691.1 SDR family oxidoreductase [Agrobacterium larrymoorei]